MTSVVEYQHWVYKPGLEDFFFEIFENGGMPKWQKLGLFLENKGFQQLKLLKNVNRQSCSANPIFLLENHWLSITEVVLL